MRLKLRQIAALFLGCAIQSSVVAQDAVFTVDLNTITTAVPFLIINPETRGGGMGDVGVATSPDANSMHWNVSKYAFIESNAGVSISYTPWLRQLVPDISLAYLSGYYKIDRMSTISGSLRYFSLGQIQFTDQNGKETIQVRPNEFAIDLGYSRKLSERFAGGLAARFINSNLTSGQMVGNTSTKPGRSAAVDLSVYYENDDISLFDRNATFAWGVHVSNVGAKISYSNATKRDYLPINLRLGPRVTVEMDDYNKISLAVDFNKYLVPSPPIYATDSSGALIRENDNFIVAAGSDPDRPVPAGVFGSFTDAPGIVESVNPDGSLNIKPGSVLGEELREINFGVGAEYWYDDQFAFRMGYFWEHLTKGNRKFITLGAGLRLNVFALDFSYLIPAYFNAAQATTNSPLSRTLRFTLSFNFLENSGGSPATTE